MRFAFGWRSGKLRRVTFFSRLQPRYLAAIVAGLLLAAAFPKWNVAGLVWIAPGFLLFTALGQGSKTSFRLGYVAGLAHYLASLYWLLFIPFPAGAIVGWLALSAYLALYPAVWVWLCWKLLPGKRVSQSNSWWAAAEQFFKTNWWQRAGWAVLCAALWVAEEMIVGRFLSGFPWNFLGASQFRMLPLIQIASITGVYGVSFLVVWFSVSMAVALLRVVRQPKTRWGWLLELRLPLVVLFAIAFYGVSKLAQPAAVERQLSVALVQPSIPQTLIWDHSQDAARFDKIIELSKLALASKPDLLIWPESSMPNFTEDNFHTITNLIATHKVWMILGADDAEPHPGATGPDHYDNFNAAFLLSPQGEYVATYRKQRLVAFGEYLPGARWLPFLRNLIPVPGDFTPGDHPVPFELKPVAAVYDRRASDGGANQRLSQTSAKVSVKLSVLICFEDVFSQLVRGYVEDDTDFLLNLTNDGWFGESAAQWQQAANGVFRAVENGVPLVRCTNNGLTCWIDEHGRIVQILSDESGNVYASGFMIAKIPLLSAGQKRALTFYHRHGDWFGWGCLAVSAIGLMLRFKQRRAPTPS